MSTPPLPTRPPVPVRPANLAPWDVKRELCEIARAVRSEGMSDDDSEQRRNDIYRRANVKDASRYEEYYSKVLPHVEDPKKVKAALQFGIVWMPLFTKGYISNAPSIDKWPGTNRKMTFRHQVMLLACVYLEYECCGRPFLFAENIVRQFWRELRHEELDKRHYERFLKYAKKRGLLSVKSSWTPSERHPSPSRFTLSGDWWKEYEAIINPTKH